MKKLLTLILLLYSVSAFAQNISEFQNIYKNNDLISKDIKFKKSLSLNISAGAFIPIKFGDEDYYIGPGFSVGLQKNLSELISLCLDFDIIYTKAKENHYYYNSINKRYITGLEFGPKFHFLKYKNLNLFASAEIGIMAVIDERQVTSFISLIPVCFSLETGFEYKLSNKVSIISKIKHNSYIAAG